MELLVVLIARSRHSPVGSEGVSSLTLRDRFRDLSCCRAMILVASPDPRDSQVMTRPYLSRSRCRVYNQSRTQ